MIAWVNCHLGFVAGLGLIAAFVGIDLLEMIVCRRTPCGRLCKDCGDAWPWYAATAVATLVNPWGWGIYSALIRQNRAMALHSGWIAEWGRVPLELALSYGNSPVPEYQKLLLPLAGDRSSGGGSRANPKTTWTPRFF